MLVVNRKNQKFYRFFLAFFRYSDSNYRVVAKKSKLCATETSIGFGTRINGPIFTKGAGSVRLGNYCAIGHDVKMITSNHDPREPVLSLWLQRFLTGEKPTTIPADILVGNNVWIGDNVLVLPGVTIGSSSIIGAGSVVTKNVEPNSIYAGIPAKRISQRIPEEKHLSIEAADLWNLRPSDLRKAYLNNPRMFG